MKLIIKSAEIAEMIISKTPKPTVTMPNMSGASLNFRICRSARKFNVKMMPGRMIPPTIITVI